MWREQILSWSGEAQLSDPAQLADIRAAEATLGQEFPSDLVDLLMETDGITDHPASTPAGPGAIVWSVRRIVADNLEFRRHPDFARLYMPFDPLLFFGDDGGGDQFAFVIRDRPPDVFRWEHETDSRSWVASRLSDYIQKRFDRRIS